MINLFNESEQNFNLPVAQQDLAVGSAVLIGVLIVILLTVPTPAE